MENQDKIQKEFKKGDKVISFTYGEGRVTHDKYEDDYPIYVRFSSIGVGASYTADGREYFHSVRPDIYHPEDFPLTSQNNMERVIEVSDVEDFSKSRHRVLVKFVTVNGKELAVCWLSAETIEDAREETETYLWAHWREIQPPKEVTIEEVAEKFGVPVEKLKIKGLQLPSDKG